MMVHVSGDSSMTGRTPVAQKNKARANGKLDAVSVVRRSLARQDYKQALKDARTAWRQHPAPELRPVLEEAYIQRVKQLVRFGLMAEARSTFEELLGLGIAEPKVWEEASAVAIPLGLLGQLMRHRAPAGAPVDARVLADLASAAVMHPGNAVQGGPAMAKDAAAVRRALDQVAAGDGEAALAGLSYIPRNSPFADWRLFVRGLAAYYRQDEHEAQASWGRLDPARVPAKIARILQALREWLSSDSLALEDLGPAHSALLEVEKVAFGEPVLSRLGQLHAQAAEQDWEGAFRTLRGLPRTVGAQNLPVLLPAAQALLASARSRGGRRLMERITEWLPGPPDDPHWHRAWALFCERESKSGLRMAARHWVDYIRDIDQGACLPGDQRLAKALVWHRAATNYLLYLDNLEGEDDDEEKCDFFPGREDTRCRNSLSAEMREELRGAAATALKKSIELAPELIEPYRDLAEIYYRWGEPGEAVAVYERLLQCHPDSLDDLVALAELLVGQGRPIEAAIHARKACQLKPLDPQLTQLLGRCLVESARCYGMQRQWDKSQAMLAEAAGLRLAPEEAGTLPAFQAVLAFKAGDLAEARSLVWRALERSPHRACGLLTITIQAKRWELPRHVASELESQWKSQLRKRFNSKAAGAMARLLSRAQQWEEGPSAVSEYLRRAIAYIGRGTKSKWDRSDLFAVCDLLASQIGWLEAHRAEAHERYDAEAVEEVGEELFQVDNLLRELCSRGMRLFPDAPEFPKWLGFRLLSDGPIDCDRPYARYVFQRLEALTQGAEDPALRVLHRRALDALEMLGHGYVSSRPRKRPCHGSTEIAYQMLARIAQYIEQLGQEEDEDDEEGTGKDPSPVR